MGEYAICIIGLGGWTPMNKMDHFNKISNISRLFLRWQVANWRGTSMPYWTRHWHYVGINRPGLGAPLSSYLEMVLYKFHR